MILTLENSTQEHNKKSQTDTNSSTKQICSITAEQQYTNTTDILDRSKEAESRSAGIIEV
jgi:hypothetical protein